MEQIISTKNNKVKQWASLKQKKFRNSTGLYLLEGVRLVEEAIDAGAPVVEILISGDPQSGRFDRIITGATGLGVELYEVSESVLEHVADTQSPQGVIAVVKKSEGDAFAFVANKEKPLYLLLDGIQDPGNLGTMIRTADAVGATGVFVGASCVDVYNPKVVRATMGSMFHLPVFDVELKELLPKLKELGVSVVGTAVDTDQTVFAADFGGAVALVIGSEAHGVSDEIAGLVDTQVMLPMPGKAESLNAAIAASVMLYEALRQRI
ncbi:RNA methyltransferase [Tumebacillus sp. ITR2]|uniref:RNA methyltransferase n=1 Tax=Tumebacillus amylolyticus TaxID=2801339 RepID=A0ABS1J9N3_9BACL|nr:RNA methyltransferase [Tumebacillus amylolyticus]MBL0386353.1 RNA methyltransferase [Tumebacillus amylolyticus]